MVNATTYSRRHRRPVGPSEDIKEEPPTRKRPRKNLDSALTEPPRKNSKSKTESMSLFRTPHPTFEAQSQVYKLPSSQPRYSPGPFSPLPIAPVIVTSKTIKENQRTGSSLGNTLWSKHSSASLTSGPRSENKRGSHCRSNFPRWKSKRSRSVSRSSSQSNSDSSSRASSEDPSHKTAYYPKSHLKHTVSLSSLDPLKDISETKPRPILKFNKQNSTPPQPLASPFVSRASSPVAVHIPTSYANKHQDIKEMETPPLPFINPKKRGALAEAFNSNLPADCQPTSRFRSHHRRSLPSVSHSTRTSPERGGDSGGAHKASKFCCGSDAELRENARRKHTRRTENSNLLKQDLSHKRKKDRERLPSAPSSLLHPRPRPLSFWVSVPAGNEEAKKLRLGSGLVVVPLRNDDAVTPPALQHVTTAKHEPTVHSISSTNIQAVIPHLIPFDLQKRQADVKDEDLDVGMAWMHTCSRVNFNRPPSQTEFLQPPGGFGPYGFAMGLDDPFFTDDDDKALSDEAEAARRGMGGKGRAGRQLDLRLHLQGSRLDLDEKRFGEDAWGVSTPFKGDKVQDEVKKEQAKEDLKNPAQDQQLQQVKHDQGFARRSNSLPMHGLGLLSAPLGLGSGLGFSLVPQLVRSKPQLDLRANDNEETEGKGEKGEELPDNSSGENMELTASATFGYLELNAVGANHQHQNLDEGDMTPWITDSLISPPTVYLERKKNAGGLAAGGEIKVERGDGEQEGKTTLTYVTRLSSSSGITSPAGLSTAFTEVTNNNEDENEDQKGEVIEKQFLQDGVTTTGGTKLTHAATSKSSTRTRSGTIVPANPVPLGVRRTRSGTIIGPLATPPTPACVPLTNKVSVGSTRRTRSGTIVANSSSATGAQTLTDDNRSASRPERMGRVKSGSMLKTKDQQMQSRSSSDSDEDNEDRIKYTSENALADHASSTNSMSRSRSTDDPKFEFDADTESDMECFTDSLYLPRLGSSPDPIDFLRFASIEDDGDEVEYPPMEFAPGNEREVCEMRWCVAEEPPSPELVRKQSGGGRFSLFVGLLGGCGRGTRSGKAKNKATKNLKARFVGVSGEEEQADAEEEDIQRLKKGKEKARETEDDELLLLPGESASLWI